jgi:hypothetical protein
MASNINADITRKGSIAGANGPDDLVIEGTLGGENLPVFPWTGATAKISIRDSSGTVAVNQAAMTTFDVATGDYAYIGAALPANKVYEYEILVTFADGKKRRFPNDRNLRMRCIPPIA